MTYERICVFLVSALGVVAILYGLVNLASEALVRHINFRHTFEAWWKFSREYFKAKGWQANE